MSKNTDTVMGIYEAFGRGDLDHILAQMRDDIAWDEGLRPTGLTYLEPGRGKDHVRRFFGELAANIEFSVFEPGPACDGGDTVIVPVREAAKNLRTGAQIPEHVATHIWTFDADGMVASLLHATDLALHEAAARETADV